jgi:hypothetical protein
MVNDSQFDYLIEKLIIEDKVENIFVSQELKEFRSEILFYINLKEAGNYNINFLNFTIPNSFNVYLNKNISYLFFNEYLYNKEVKYNINKYINIKKLLIEKLSFLQINEYLIIKNKINYYKYKYSDLCSDQLNKIKNFSLILMNDESKYNSEIINIIYRCNYLVKTKIYNDNFIIISYSKKL